MQNSSQPKLIPTPFADNGARQNIPNDSQIGITAGRASYVDGFPPLTRTPLAAGGVPPFGTDFNGVLNDITAALRWSQSGSGYPFNAAFNTAISGYPKGAKIPNSTLDGYWLNTVDGNTANPEVTGAATTGWVPAENYGVTAITGLSGSSVTLTTLQASKERITLAGTLSANINLVLPAWQKSWTVVNGCSGSFSVTVKTPSGNGVAVNAGKTAILVGDGVNITQDSLPPNFMRFVSSGPFTVPQSVYTLYLSGCGAGGGGGAGGGAINNASFGGGGGGGAAGESVIRQPVSVTPGQVINITIGTAGTKGLGNTSSAGPGGNGGAGGDTIIGSLKTLRGGGFGGGGGFGTSYAQGGSPGAGYPNGAPGNDGSVNYATATGGYGASSPFGGGGGGGKASRSASSPNLDGYGYGSGGGGGGGIYPNGETAGIAGINGGNGTPGFLIIEW